MPRHNPLSHQRYPTEMCGKGTTRTEPSEALISASATLFHSGIGLPHGSTRQTERSRGYRDGLPSRCQHRPGLLADKPFCRRGSLSTGEEKVMHCRQAYPLSGVVEPSPWRVPQGETPVATFHMGAGALAHLCAFGRLCLARVLRHCGHFSPRSTGGSVIQVMLCSRSYGIVGRNTSGDQGGGRVLWS
jgi:hypothetical protein